MKLPEINVKYRPTYGPYTIWFVYSDTIDYVCKGPRAMINEIVSHFTPRSLVHEVSYNDVQSLWYTPSDKKTEVKKKWRFPDPLDNFTRVTRRWDWERERRCYQVEFWSYRWGWIFTRGNKVAEYSFRHMPEKWIGEWYDVLHLTPYPEKIQRVKNRGCNNYVFRWSDNSKVRAGVHYDYGYALDHDYLYYAHQKGLYIEATRVTDD